MKVITYNLASDYYDHPANSFWERFGRKAVERLQLQPGSHILDVCCRSGASALPAEKLLGLPDSYWELILLKNCLNLDAKKRSNVV